MFWNLLNVLSLIISIIDLGVGYVGLRGAWRTLRAPIPTPPPSPQRIWATKTCRALLAFGLITVLFIEYYICKRPINFIPWINALYFPEFARGWFGLIWLFTIITYLAIFGGLKDINNGVIPIMLVICAMFSFAFMFSRNLLFGIPAVFYFLAFLISFFFLLPSFIVLVKTRTRNDYVHYILIGFIFVASVLQFLQRVPDPLLQAQEHQEKRDFKNAFFFYKLCKDSGWKIVEANTGLAEVLEELKSLNDIPVDIVEMDGKIEDYSDRNDLEKKIDSRIRGYRNTAQIEADNQSCKKSN